MRRRGRTDETAAIRRRGRERKTDRIEQTVHDRVRGHPQRQRIETCRHRVGQVGSTAARQHQRERSGPVLLCQAFGDGRKFGQGTRLRQRRNMDDQRIEARPPLGRVDLGDRRVAIGAGSETIDRFGRHGDKPAITQDFRGAHDATFLDVKRFRSVFAAHARALYLPAHKAKRIPP